MTDTEKPQHDNTEKVPSANAVSLASSAESVSFNPNPKSNTVSKQRRRAVDFFLSTVLGRYLARKTGAPLDIDRSEDGQSEPRRTWTTTYLRFGPLSGIFMICLSVLCLLGCLGILVGSNGRSTHKWSVPPSTGIAIFTAVSNLSIRYAALQGVVIAWWTRAARGSTFDRLHHDWRSGTTLRGAITSGRHMGLLGLACIFSTLVVIDGPFLQRSTSVVLAPNPNTVDLDVWMAEEIPHGLTGGWGYTEYWYGAWAPASLGFNRTVPSPSPNGTVSNSRYPFASWWMNKHVLGPWLANQPLSSSIRGCPGTCSAKIRAPALAPVACESFVIPVDYHRPHNWTFLTDHWVSPPLGTEQLLIAPDLVILPDREEINLVTGYNTLNGGCTGVFNYTSCILRSAIGEYDVRVSQEEAFLIDPGKPRIVGLANNTAPDSVWNKRRDGYPSTLAGVASGALHNWNAICYQQGYADGTLSPFCGGPYGAILQFQTKREFCAEYRDPRSTVMASLNTLMFSVGGVAALHHPAEDLEAHMDAGLPVRKTVVGNVDGDHTVFHSSYAWFVAAVVVQAATIAMVAPTYWGWWRLGRSMSFSPLELAKAFEAPAFDDINSNASGRDIAKAKFNEPVRYGAVVGRVGTAKLAFADPALVKRPGEPSQFDV